MGQKLFINVEYKSIRDADNKVIDYQKILTLTQGQVKAIQNSIYDDVPAPPNTLEEVIRIQRARGQR